MTDSRLYYIVKNLSELRDAIKKMRSFAKEYWKVETLPTRSGNFFIVSVLTKYYEDFEWSFREAIE